MTGRRNDGWHRLRGFFLLLAAVAVLLCFLIALDNLNRGQDEEGRQRLEESLRRAAVAYYAAEGVYPPTLKELIRRSGVQIDRKRYHVFYEIFADNLMPDITVLGMDV